MVGGTKVCSQHLGHMAKIAATPIYGTNPSQIFFSRSGGLQSSINFYFSNSLASFTDILNLI